MSEKTTVSVNLGYTMNLGNFQSFRVDLGCTDYVRDGENADAAMNRVYAFIEGKVEEKMKEANQEISGG